MGYLKAALTAIFSTNTYTSSSANIGSKFVGIHESNGAASGIMNMPNLASVLGGVATNLTSQDNLNDVTNTGVYYWSGSASAPQNAFRPQGSLLLVWRIGTQVFQVQWPNNFASADATGNIPGIGLRVKWNSVWQGVWYKMA